MDLYGNKVKFATAGPVRISVGHQIVDTGKLLDRFGCLACTSGDSPIWDVEQNILFGNG